MKSFNRIFLALLLAALAFVPSAQAQIGDLGEGLPAAENYFQTPMTLENEPLAIDQPWGQAVPEFAPEEDVISLNMRGVDITEVLRVMFKWAGYNYAINPSVSGKVTVGLENVPFNVALRAVLEQVGATFIKAEGIYRIEPEAVTATGGVSSIGIPQTPKRLRIVEVRFTAASEMARIFGGKAAGANALYGGFESWEVGSGNGSSSNISLSRGTSSTRTTSSTSSTRTSGSSSSRETSPFSAAGR